MKKKLLIVASLLLLCLSFVHPVSAYAADDTGIQLSPAIIRIDLKPGEDYQTEVFITNTGSIDYDFKIFQAPYSVHGDDYDQDFTTKNDRTELVDWVTFPDGDTYHAAAKEKVGVKVNIKIPATSIAGGQYAVLFAETAPSANSGSSGVTVGKRVGALMFGKVDGELFVDGEVFEQKLDNWYQGSKIEASFKATNRGNIDDVAKYSLKVKTIFGGDVYQTDENATKSIIPNTTRLVNVSTDDLGIGLFNVSFTQNFNGKDYEKSQLVLVAPLWILIFIPVLFIIILLIMLLIRRSQKRTKELKALRKLTSEQTANTVNISTQPQSTLNATDDANGLNTTNSTITDGDIKVG